LNNYLYRGEQYDLDLGLYYLRARYYNPLTGRFMSQDPKVGEIKEPQSLHKYLYAGGDPVNRIDPHGRADTADYTSLLQNESWKTQLEMRATAYAVRVELCVDAVMLQWALSGGVMTPVYFEMVVAECREI
jgi:RHS repeat-associated protein